MIGDIKINNIVKLIEIIFKKSLKENISSQKQKKIENKK
jgi:hypothetical protein